MNAELMLVEIDESAADEVDEFEYASFDPLEQVEVLEQRAETLARGGVDTLPGAVWSVQMEHPERGYLHSLAECIECYGVNDAHVLRIVRFTHLGSLH